MFNASIACRSEPSVSTTPASPWEMCPIDAEKQVKHSVGAAKWDNCSGLTITTAPRSARLCPRLGWRSPQPAFGVTSVAALGDAADAGQVSQTSATAFSQLRSCLPGLIAPSLPSSPSMWFHVIMNGYQVTGAAQLNSRPLPVIGTSACTDTAASQREWSLWTFRVKDCGCRGAWPTEGGNEMSAA